MLRPGTAGVCEFGSVDRPGTRSSVPVCRTGPAFVVERSNPAIVATGPSRLASGGTSAGFAYSVASSFSPLQRDGALFWNRANKCAGLVLPSNPVGRLWHTFLIFQFGRGDEARTLLARGVVAGLGGRAGGQPSLARILAALLLDFAAIAVFDRECSAPESAGIMALPSNRIAGRSNARRHASCRRICRPDCIAD